MRTVLDAARLLNWSCYHSWTSIRSAAGWPDLFCCHPAHGALALELKTARGTVSERQRFWLDALNAAGIPAFVARPDDWPKIEKILKGEDACDAPS